ncbi:MAG TPA: hypothetical protein VE988_23850 [Gemmataceae bacterium]|nr:hypothetical protein [Gemmataceae bacterium]
MLFTSPQDDVISSLTLVDSKYGKATTAKVARGSGAEPGGLVLTADRGSAVDLSNQFVVFQLGSQIDGHSVLECSRSEPAIDGRPEEPDVLVALEMLSFHLAESEKVGSDTRATMRINFGKDESSTDKRFDTLFWSIAAGLTLYDQANNRKPVGKDLKGDFQKAFGNRPIEIPGGLGRLSFEVVKHTEPSWWKRIFSFMQSDTGAGLVSVLGFPAITNQAIKVLDELLDRLGDSKPEPLFKSLPLRLALSKYARDSFTGGNTRIKMGCLRPGFCIMARGRDFKVLSNADVIYFPAYGRLVPNGVTEADLLAGAFEDPLRDVTYTVFRLGMKGTRLDPTFNFGA